MKTPLSVFLVVSFALLAFGSCCEKCTYDSIVEYPYDASSGLTEAEWTQLFPRESTVSESESYCGSDRDAVNDPWESGTTEVTRNGITAVSSWSQGYSCEE